MRFFQADLKADYREVERLQKEVEVWESAGKMSQQ